MPRKIIPLIFFVFSISILSAQITEIGQASFYADKFDGRITASGAVFKQNKLTAAHRTLPFGSKVRVTNLDNNKIVEVEINDRGPFVNDRVIDLSKSAARKLDFIKRGVAKVKVEVLNIPKGKTKTNYKYSAPKTSGSKNSYKKQNSENSNSVTISSNNEYYEVSTTKISPNGYGIQVASYQEAANLIKRCDDIQLQTNKNVLVQIGDSNGKKVYRIIVGTFSTREKADSFNKKIRSKFKGCFVVAF